MVRFLTEVGTFSYSESHRGRRRKSTEVFAILCSSSFPLPPPVPPHALQSIMYLGLQYKILPFPMVAGNCMRWFLSPLFLNPLDPRLSIFYVIFLFSFFLSLSSYHLFWHCSVFHPFDMPVPDPCNVSFISLFFSTPFCAY